MRPANKIQNKIHITRSRSVHLLFALQLNSVGATVERGGRGSAFTPKNVEVLQCGRRLENGSWWQAVLADLGASVGCPARGRNVQLGFPKRSGIRDGGNQP